MRLYPDFEQLHPEMLDVLRVLASYETSSHFIHSLDPADMARVKQLLAKLETAK